MTPEVHVHFTISQSCNKCLPAFLGCCRREPSDDDEFFVNSKQELERWSPKKGDEDARAIANQRFLNLVDKRITEMGLDREKALEFLGKSLPRVETPEPITKGRVEQVADALTLLSKAVFGVEDGGAGAGE